MVERLLTPDPATTTVRERLRVVAASVRSGLVLAASVLVLVALGGEAYFRLPWVPRRLAYDADPELGGGVIAPDQRATDWLANMSMRTPPMAINSEGRRGRETDWSKPVVLTVGDSQWFGVGVEDDEVWTVLLEAKFREGLHDDGIQVVNAAQPGYGPEHQTVVLRRIVAAHAVKLILVRVTVGQTNFRTPRGDAARIEFERAQRRKILRGLTSFGPFLLDKIRAQEASVEQALVPHFLRRSAPVADDDAAGTAMWDCFAPAWREMVRHAIERQATIVFVVDNVENLTANDWLANRLREEFADIPGVHVLPLGPEAFGLAPLPHAEITRLVHDTLTLGRDPHGNAEFHRRTAAAVWEGLRARHLSSVILPQGGRPETHG